MNLDDEFLSTYSLSDSLISQYITQVYDITPEFIPQNVSGRRRSSLTSASPNNNNRRSSGMNKQSPNYRKPLLGSIEEVKEREEDVTKNEGIGGGGSGNALGMEEEDEEEAYRKQVIEITGGLRESGDLLLPWDMEGMLPLESAALPTRDLLPPEDNNDDPRASLLGNFFSSGYKPVFVESESLYVSSPQSSSYSANSNGNAYMNRRRSSAMSISDRLSVPFTTPSFHSDYVGEIPIQTGPLSPRSARQQQQMQALQRFQQNYQLRQQQQQQQHPHPHQQQHQQEQQHPHQQHPHQQQHQQQQQYHSPQNNLAMQTPPARLNVPFSFSMTIDATNPTNAAAFPKIFENNNNNDSMTFDFSHGHFDNNLTASQPLHQQHQQQQQQQQQQHPLQSQHPNLAAFYQPTLSSWNTIVDPNLLAGKSNLAPPPQQQQLAPSPSSSSSAASPASSSSTAAFPPHRAEEDDSAGIVSKEDLLSAASSEDTGKPKRGRPRNNNKTKKSPSKSATPARSPSSSAAASSSPSSSQKQSFASSSEGSNNNSSKNPSNLQFNSPFSLENATATTPDISEQPSSPISESVPTPAPTSERKAEILLAEQKRRKILGDGFDRLLEAIPCEKDKKYSKAQLLNRAVEYVRFLKKRQMVLRYDLEEIERDTARIALENKRILDGQKNFYPVDTNPVRQFVYSIGL